MLPFAWWSEEVEGSDDRSWVLSSSLSLSFDRSLVRQKTITRSLGLTFGDSLSRTTSSRTTATKILSSSLTLAFSRSLTKNRIITRTLGLTFGDSLARSTSSRTTATKVLTSSMTLSFSRVLKKSKLISRTLALTFGDSIGLTEDDQTPAAPTSLGAQDNLTAGHVDLSWNDNADNEDNYEVQRAPAGTGTWSTLTSTLAANSTTYTDTTSVCDTAYDYRVRATNSRGDSGWSNTVTFTPCDIA